MSQKFEKLKTLLKELFQLDQPDLDFGLYRIMHSKSAEVSEFLDKDLLPQVKEAFGLYKTADKAELEKELANAIERAQSLGADPETLPKVKELRARLVNDAVDIGGLENEVYEHLFSFFRRYYLEGDFLAKRVYRPGVYAIPYEGEEVKFHWANRDQYYIKTSEYLRDYAFRLRPDDATAPMRVHFRLVDAAEGEHGNVKAAEGKDRVFVLASEDFIAEEDRDTRFFESAFKDRLLGTIDTLDSTIDGTLIHSDNFQALQLVRGRMREQVKCVYIDPPYNTASSSIPYKNNYRHSSWASMMYDRIASLHPLLPDDGAIFVSIDKAERTVLGSCHIWNIRS